MHMPMALSTCLHFLLRQQHRRRLKLASSESSTSSQASAANAEPPPRVRNDNPRTTSAGFDPEALERGAKALREINDSSHAKKVSTNWFLV